MFAATPEGEAARRSLNEALDDLDHGWNEHGFEMGQRYDEGALVTDGTPWPVNGKDPYLFYQATSHPGAKLPHAWVERRGRAVSTLDVTPPDAWGLITGPGGEGWGTAAKKVANEFGIEIVTTAIGPGLDWEDPHADWAKVREIGESGCLLVRPDRHVAWRAFEARTDAADALRGALSIVVGKSITV